MSNVKCQLCSGTGESSGFVDGGGCGDNSDGGWCSKLICYMCGGKGHLPANHEKMIEDGRKLRIFRTSGPSGFMNLVQFGCKFGLTPSQVTAMEHGKVEIPDSVRTAVGLDV